jgi:glucuronate isomerase
MDNLTNDRFAPEAVMQQPKVNALYSSDDAVDRILDPARPKQTPL